MYLLSEYRGKGNGKQLLDTALEFVRNSDYRRVELDTHSQMEKARKLYRSAGFRELDRPARGCCCNQAMYLDMND
jgi:ribosomal protein S18 acetylase RimI-like enzyme